MSRLSKPFILGLFLVLTLLSTLNAQTAHVETGAAAAIPSPAGQAPDDVMKKLSELVHAGKYAEAQQLTSGLLLAYPDDQRLIKAKTLLDKSLASSKPEDTTANRPQ